MSEWRWLGDSEKKIHELIQYYTDYVVHCRGFTFDYDIWMDEFSVYGSHYHQWDNHIKQYYDIDLWTDYDGIMLYWSITGSGSFILRSPIAHTITERELNHIHKFLQLLDLSEDDSVLLRNGLGKNEYVSTDVNLNIDLDEITEPE